MKGFDILQITKPQEYHRRLELIRSNKLDAKLAMEKVRDPLEIHHNALPSIPSFQQAEASAAATDGEIYCFWCASHHVIKGGHKDKRLKSYAFKCKDCNSTFSYEIPKVKYDAFNGLKLMKKGKYKPRKKSRSIAHNEP